MLTRRLPRGSANIRDQLERAMSSAILNLAEGNGRRSIKDRNRFFDISLGSIAEVSAAIDIISAYGYIPAGYEHNLKSQLAKSYGMIMNLRR